MKEELIPIQKNDTRESVNLPSKKKENEVTWVFKTKMKLNSGDENYKSRLVAKGFLQRPDLNFNEIYTRVARIETIILLVALESKKGWILRQLDAKYVFLNCPLEKCL